jgi:Tfp pilus assembly protein PilO
MSSWSVETRNRVLMLALATGVVLGVIWFFLINTLQASLGFRTAKIQAVQRQLQVMRTGIEKAEQYKDVIRRGGLLLGAYENQMAQGDLFRWAINSLREVQARHNVTITTFNPPQLGQLNIPPKVPYTAGTYSIAGMARYHDFGSFLADLENSSPFIRIKSLALEATSSGVAEAERPDALLFRMEFVTLIKAAPPQR